MAKVPRTRAKTESDTPSLPRREKKNGRKGASQGGILAKLGGGEKTHIVVAASALISLQVCTVDIGAHKKASSASTILGRGGTKDVRRMEMASGTHDYLGRHRTLFRRRRGVKGLSTVKSSGESVPRKIRQVSGGRHSNYIFGVRGENEPKGEVRV